MTDRDEEEQQLRIDQMTINIEKLRSDLKWEPWKALISMGIAVGILTGGATALLNYWRIQQPIPQQFTFPPGTVITIPPTSK